jgi:hypothetical protein
MILKDEIFLMTITYQSTTCKTFVTKIVQNRVPSKYAIQKDEQFDDNNKKRRKGSFSADHDGDQLQYLHEIFRALHYRDEP